MARSPYWHAKPTQAYAFVAGQFRSLHAGGRFIAIALVVLVLCFACLRNRLAAASRMTLTTVGFVGVVTLTAAGGLSSGVGPIHAISMSGHETIGLFAPGAESKGAHDTRAADRQPANRHARRTASTRASSISQGLRNSVPASSSPTTTIVPTTTTVPKMTASVRPTPVPPKRRAVRSPTDAVSPTTTSTTTTTTPAVETPGLSSANWSGYVLTDGGYEAVSGEWTVPTLNCAVVPNGGTSDWVGVNGWVDRAGLVQSGTYSLCSSGAQLNFAVWSDAALGYAWQQQFQVTAGDVIDAEVSQTTSGSWVATVTDLTSGQSATASEPAVFAGSSAEWIAEDSGVAGSSSLAPLADFSPVTFSDLSTAPASTLSYADAIEMQRANGSVEALPSPPQGASFTVTDEPAS